MQEIQPDVVVFCPAVNKEAAVAAKILGLPSVAFITHAGPGSFSWFFPEFLHADGHTQEDIDCRMRSWAPAVAATSRLNAKYGLDLHHGWPGCRPFGYLEGIGLASCGIVTTSEDLADPVSPELKLAYATDDVVFKFVGPLLDHVGAVRAGASIGDDMAARDSETVSAVRKARSSRRPVVLVSMGTVLTSSHKMFGWNARCRGADGLPYGLTGRQLCQAAWKGVFDAFGAAAADEGPLIVVSTSNQVDALVGLVVPPNALCQPYFPQVDILKVGVDLFLTHGGQNSFTEALSHGVPVVVCPGFGDQIINSRKAISLGVGLKVDRPNNASGDEVSAAEQYRKQVCENMRAVLEGDSFRMAAEGCARRLHMAGGTPRGAEVVLGAANCIHNHRPGTGAIGGA